MQEGFKKTIGVIILIFVILALFAIGLTKYFNAKKTFDLAKMEYRTDVQPLVDRFGDKISIDACWWKADIIGKTNLGPSSYWMKGFALLNKQSVESIQAKYHLISTSLEFEQGMHPCVTEFEEFEWRYSEELSREIAGAGFIGEIYVDLKNSVLYFDLESN